MGEIINVHKMLVGKPEGKRHFGRPKHRWKSNIRTDFREIWWESMDWSYLVQDRGQWRAVVNMVMNLQVP
jgi:hypothetical protein